ncbi:MAG: HIT domain-containing protein [Propionibacteriaceae bacterium]|jgi:ATP adenylyltransferase|nr:HIT domain-containing protein [Propionibacteriaceae bacterium]
MTQPEVFPAEDMVGAPDGFQRLWTPHRMAYVASHRGPVRSCPFCEAPELDQEETLVVTRGETCYVVLNLYPYNSGHVLVCPYRHVAYYTDLNMEEVTEMAHLTRQAMTTLEAVYRATGFNIGMNQGVAGGAGIVEHVHQHVVPRWNGDANFFPIIAQTKALSQLLPQTRDALAQQWGQQ